MGSKSFLDLNVWKVAREVYLSVYRATEEFPRRDMFGISEQLRQAAWSIPANIAEGFGRRSTRDKAHFYTMAMGSTEGLKYGLIAARDLGRLKNFKELWPKLESISRMTRSLTDAVLEGGSRVQPWCPMPATACPLMRNA